MVWTCVSELQPRNNPNTYGMHMLSLRFECRSYTLQSCMGIQVTKRWAQKYNSLDVDFEVRTSAEIFAATDDTFCMSVLIPVRDTVLGLGRGNN